MIIALLLLAQTKTVTFSHPCASSAVVLEALGKQLGVQMKPSGSVMKDFFAVRFTDRSADEIKRLIAETLSAEWVQRGEYLVLDRGLKQHAEELSVENSVLRSRIATFLEKNPAKKFDATELKTRLANVVAAANDVEKQKLERAQLHLLRPETSLATRLITVIGIESILAVKDGEELTYEGSSMSLRLREVLDEYTHDLVAASEAAAQVGGEGEVLRNHIMPTDKHNFRVTVSRDYGEVRLALVHKVKGSVNESISSSNLAHFDGRIASTERLQLTGLKGKLELTGVANSLVKVQLSRGMRPEANDGSPTAEERIVAITLGKDLSSNELLAIYGEAPLKAVARQLNRDYVALLPDAVLGSPQWMRATDSLQQAWVLWSSLVSVRVDKSTGVLQIAPMYFREGRDSRFDRVAASTLISQFARDNRITLDSLGRLALACKSRAQFSSTASRAYTLLPVGRWGGNDWSSLRVYAGLNSQQRQTAETQELVIPWTRMPRSARDAIAATLREQESNFSIVPVPLLWTYGGGYTGEPSLDARRLPSIPNDAEVRVRIERISLLQTEPASLVTSRLHSPSEMAAMIVSSPTVAAAMLAVIDAERIVVEVYVPKLGYVTLFAQADSATHATEYVDRGKLPEPWKSQLAEAIKKNGGGNP